MSPGNNKNECVAARKHWKDRSTDVRERGKQVLFIYLFIYTLFKVDLHITLQ